MMAKRMLQGAKTRSYMVKSLYWAHCLQNLIYCCECLTRENENVHLRVFFVLFLMPTSRVRKHAVSESEETQTDVVQMNCRVNAHPVS